MLAVTGSITGTIQRQAVVTQELNQQAKEKNIVDGESVETSKHVVRYQQWILDLYNSLPEQQIKVIEMQIEYLKTLDSSEVTLQAIANLEKQIQDLREKGNGDTDKAVQKNQLLAQSIKGITNEMARMIIAGEDIRKIKIGDIIGQMLLSGLLTTGVNAILSATPLAPLLGIAAAKKHSGGMIGGNSENIPIVAQSGEFVVQRSAVESVGVETLNRINQTGQAGNNIVLNVSAPLVDDTIIDTIIPAINDAVRRGETLG